MSLKYFLLSFFFLLFSFHLFSQKRMYDVYLFGKKIGKTEVERVAKEGEVVEYNLESRSEMNIFFSRKTSFTQYHVVYKNGKLFSSYYKDVKDGVTEVVSILWDGSKYIIRKGEEILEFTEPVHFSAMSLYFNEPKNMEHFFSERLTRFFRFIKKPEGIYECQLEKGVSASYYYKNGLLQELQMSKGVSVVMKLVK